MSAILRQSLTYSEVRCGMFLQIQFCSSFQCGKERSIAAETYSVAAKVFCNELESLHLFE